MKTAKKMLSVILCALMLIYCIQLFAAAGTLYNEDKKTVTIFVDGINSANLISAETGETLFPPQASTIVSAVMESLPTVAPAVLSENYDKAAPSLVEAVNKIFIDIACDENGKPSASTAFDWEWPTEEEVIAELEREDLGAQIKYGFDWRLDMKTIATDLHSYIEYIMDIAGAEKVNLIGFSMGTCAVMSYLRLFDYEYVNAVVLLAGGFNGVSCCGEPFSGKINLNSDAIVRYVDTLLGYELGDVLLSAMLHYLNDSGIIDPVIDWGNKITVELKDAVYQGVFAKTFATMPGMWALVPESCYEDGISIIGNSLSQTTLDLIAWYHDEVQAKSEEIIQGCLDRGINFGIIAKYGFSGMPVMNSADAMCDGMIDTTYESLGAICADVDTTLGENYQQKVDVGFDCISPDNMIDASTCAFPKYTWFVKNSYHSDHYKAMMQLCYYIIQSDKQVSVLDGEYSQFLTVVDDTPVALTSENDYVKYTVDFSEDNFATITADLFTGTFGALKQFIIDFIARFKALFSFSNIVC